MKIAVLAPVAWRTPPRHYGPWELVSSNITEGLVESGLDVTLFATGDSITKAQLTSIISRGYEEDKDTDAKVLECMHISFLMERAHGFDLIHNNFDFLPLTYSRLIKAPVVTTIHGFSSKKIIPVYKRYNDIGHYVSISYADRSSKLNYIANVYNGIRKEEFTPRKEQGKYLLYFGRIHHDKGCWEAIQIAKKAGMKLIISGLIQDETYYQEKVEPYINGEQIEYIGNSGPEKRDEVLGGALALLHPINFKEPFGLSVAEAMFCGTPVIAFKKGSMPELIEDGKTGFLLNSVDEAVERLEDIKTIDRTYCRKYAEAKFGQEKMVRDYIEVYKKVLRR